MYILLYHAQPYKGFLSHVILNMNRNTSKNITSPGARKYFFFLQVYSKERNFSRSKKKEGKEYLSLEAGVYYTAR